MIRGAMTAAVVVSAAVTCGCTSPEATRPRGGRGADVGNRKAIVDMHEGSEPFWRTPSRMPYRHPPLERARQAAESSRR